MEKNEIKINKNLGIEKTLINEKEQKNFLETMLGKTINTAVDIGIRALLPDFIDDQIINVKNNLLDRGLKEGITKSVNDAIDLGKSAMGIVTGSFENINQMHTAVKTGGIIDSVSSLIDTVLDKVNKKGVIDKNVVKTIKHGKNVILNNVESNIESSFSNQLKSAEYMNKYIDNWKEYYNKQDFLGMEKEYKKIQKELGNLVPLEQIINQARIIENLHMLIKNKEQNFDLTAEEIELAKKLI